MKIHLLIIETDDEIRENLVQRLSLDQYLVLGVDHPKKVDEIIKKKKIDVVLLGLVGLREEGLSVLKLIKRVRPLTEIIMISDSAKIPLSMQGMKLGAFEDFYMPFELSALIQTIQAAYLKKAENERVGK
jgi:DNA-binding NtrC family response regulator